MKNLIISGMLRSGTTLLEKLLYNHPELGIYSQPYPYVYVHFKQMFYDSKKVEDKMPLDNYFLNDAYTTDDFYHFLDCTAIRTEMIETIFRKMFSYSGQGEKRVNDERFIKRLRPGRFSTFYEELLHLLSKIETETRTYYGMKEVLNEEYLPYILEKVTDSKAIIILRDPRDVMTSLNYGEHEKYTGISRPLLFDIRNWRKSVAFATYLKHHKHFIIVRYEDLIKNPYKKLNQITDFLGVSTYDERFLEKGIYDQNGKLWGGNSSFGQKGFINKDSVGKYKTHLNKKMIRLIEHLCLPEMHYLGYDFQETAEFSKDFIQTYSEALSSDRQELNERFLFNNENKALELMRYDMLTGHHKNKKISDYFIFDKVLNEFQKKGDWD